ncbi:MAG: hypothetical protein ACEQSL_01515 [Sediminibacterium sp.]
MIKFLGVLCVCLFALVFRIQAQHHVQCDALGNTYDIFPDHITKHSSNFNLDYRLSTLQYGTSAQLDLTNPLVPFLFFEDQGSLVFFDNNLNVLEDPIFLNEKFQGQITCVAGSKGDALWLYDANSSTLIRTNRKFEVLSKSANLSYLTKTTLQPEQIIENGQRVYLIDAEKGISIFSLFGNIEIQSVYYSADPVYHWNNFIYFRMYNILFEWENSLPEPTKIAYFDTKELRLQKTWTICEGKPYFIDPETGLKQEIPILENLDK